MSNTVAITTALAVSSSYNNSESSESKVIACKAIEQSFNNSIATISQKQQYANCIDYLYTTSSDILFTKTLIVLAFISFIIAFCVPFFGKGYERYEFGYAFCCGLGFAFIVPFAVGLSWIGIWFLFFN